MEEVLNRILSEIQGLRYDVRKVEQNVQSVEQKLDDFRESQEMTNKLLAGEAAGIKSQLRDFRRDVREWQLLTSRRIDRIEEKLSGMRDALQ
jgi:predicted  nucleic acid-binding Zn-ribbon protein